MADDFVWSQGLLVLFCPADLLALLYPADLRSFFTCSKSTSWRNMHPYLSGVLKQIMSSHHEQYGSAMRCTHPRSNWSEEFPICSALLCRSFTGLWLPSIDELQRMFGANRTGYMCGSFSWGSVTIRSILEERAWEGPGARSTGARAFVACCPDCGKLLKEIARIQGRHDHVLLASHDRAPPNARMLEESFGPHWAELVPQKHLLRDEWMHRTRVEEWMRRTRRRLD